MVSWLAQDKEAVRIFTNTTDPAAWGSESFAIARFTPYNLSPGTVPAASNWVHRLYAYVNSTNTNFGKSPKTASCGSKSQSYSFFSSKANFLKLNS